MSSTLIAATMERDYILENVKDKSDYDKIRIIHDYLRDTIDYDSTISKNNIYDISGNVWELTTENYNKEAVVRGGTRRDDEASAFYLD